MYKKNFVAAIKVGGKVLRESNERVELPFGSEYSILLKNLDSVRVRASIQIDGEDAVNGVVIQPNSEIEIERFLRPGSGAMDQGNRFKFIERTGKIEAHRGIKADDGLVRISFEREKVYQAPQVVEHHTYHHHTYPWHLHYPGPIWINAVGGLQGQTTNSSSRGTRALMASSNSVSATMDWSGPISEPIVASNFSQSQQNMMKHVQENEAGITVDGSLSNQRFVPVQGFDCEPEEVLVLHLIGRSGGSPIQIAKTVRAKLSCETCGTKNKSSSKFCKQCGTSLEKF